MRNYDYIAVLSYQVRLDELVLVAITTRHDARPNPLFRSVLPVGATGIDLIERIQLPSDSLYPMDYLVTSSLEANDYRSRLNRRFCVPPRTPNGSYLVPSSGNYPSLLRSCWMSTATDTPLGGASDTSLSGGRHASHSGWRQRKACF
jgi:hypothetical protein